jgi:2-hydroxychromene-2-carboxylate isomerase
MEDVERIAAAYGLAVRWPGKIDTDWMRPHAACLHAGDAGLLEPFVAAGFRARFQRGLDLGQDEVLEQLAEEAGLEPRALVAACDAPELHARIRAGLARFAQRKLFGVPFFVFQGRRFWGNDRLEWLLRDVCRELGEPVPDLASDPFARPCPAPLG